MENLIAWTVMAGVSLPLSFLIARGCLRGLVRLMSMGVNAQIARPVSRDVL
jgi:hypothetical protein